MDLSLDGYVGPSPVVVLFQRSKLVLDSRLVLGLVSLELEFI